MPSNLQNQAIIALAALGQSEAQIAAAVGVEMGDVESVLAGGTFTPPGVPLSGGGGGSAGSPVVRKFPFAFDTPDLLTGAALYTPTVGDILFDAWIEITTAWDGTTPLGDIGTFTGRDGAYGYFTQYSAVDMTIADTNGQFDALLTQPNGPYSSLSQLAAEHRIAGSGGGYPRQYPAKFIAAHPIKVCVSQDGTNIGADPGSTVGAAILYLVTATPA